MRPEASKTKPDPTPVDGTENGPYPPWPAASTVIVTTAGLADSATATAASEAETLTGVVEALVLAAPTGPVPAPRSVAPNPLSSPMVPTDPTTAESMETARTPASHRPRNGQIGRAHV